MSEKPAKELVPDEGSDTGTPSGDIKVPESSEATGTKEVVTEEVKVADDTKTEEKKSAVLGIKESVAQLIVGSSGTVRNLVINKLADELIEKRAGILEKAFASHNTKGKALRSIKADSTTYSSDGTPNEQWSKKALDEKKQLTEQIKSFSKLIDKACEPEATAQDWDKLAKKC